MTTPMYSAAEMMVHHGRVIEEFRANRGKVGGVFADAPLLLLTTTGARSGQPRTTPLTSTEDGSRLVVIAANQGAATNPDWYHNLVANPRVTVELGDERFAAIARVTVGEERQRLFDQMAARRPNFLESQRKTTRQLPVIVLERAIEQFRGNPPHERIG